jgi:biopolymer transport protein ExbD
MKRTTRPCPPHEPDLIPVMNLVCLLIPFLLLTAVFIQYASVDVRAPRFVPDPGRRSHEQPLDLTVLVTDEGFTLTAGGRPIDGRNAGADASAGRAPTIPMARQAQGAEYDYAALTTRLRRIKDANEAESQVRIGAERNIDFQTVVKVMDAARGDDRGELFPDVVLLAGVI